MQRLLRSKSSGGDYEKATPVPIPNTAVKLLSAENTWMATSRENRSPPDLYQNPSVKAEGFCIGRRIFFRRQSALRRIQAIGKSDRSEQNKAYELRVAEFTR